MMLWPFNHFRKSPAASGGTIDTIYGAIVARAREPQFYEHFGVPDTVDGRFDLLVLHLWMVLRRLEPLSGSDDLAQALFDHFCSDMDANLREMGVGDLTVPKRMQKFGESFYGRSAAYDAALAQGAEQGREQGIEALAQALCKNVLNGRRPDDARRLARYVEASIAHLSACDDAALRNGGWRFAPIMAPTV
jgi:cytochrome b pre-mRNA-processing protein 3